MFAKQTNNLKAQIFVALKAVICPLPTSMLLTLQNLWNFDAFIIYLDYI